MRLMARSSCSSSPARLSASLAGSAAPARGVAFAALRSVAALCVAALFGVPALSSPALAATSAQRAAAVAVATPSTVTSGTAVTLQVTCGSPQATSAVLRGTTLGLPEQIPMNSLPSGGGVFSVTITLPSGIQPGRFKPAIDCSDGTSATASVRVTAVPSSAAAQTSYGTTSTAKNTSLTAIGLALIAVGAVAGGIALRRRSGTRS
jgi:hypothetical protein